MFWGPIKIYLFVFIVLISSPHQSGCVHQVALTQVCLIIKHQKLPKVGRVENHDVLVLRLLVVHHPGDRRLDQSVVRRCPIRGDGQTSRHDRETLRLTVHQELFQTGLKLQHIVVALKQPEGDGGRLRELNPPEILFFGPVLETTSSWSKVRSLDCQCQKILLF